MAKLTLRNGLDASTTDINELDLETTTPAQIIAAAVENGILQQVAGEEFKVIGKNNQPITEDSPLSKLGFEDGDTITVVSKPRGAAVL